MLAVDPSLGGATKLPAYVSAAPTQQESASPTPQNMLDIVNQITQRKIQQQKDFQASAPSLISKIPHGGSTFGGSKVPDWNTWYADAMEKLGISQIDSDLKRAQEQAIINFGDPALAQMAGFGIDPQAADFAKQNYLSGNATLARLNKQHDLAKRSILNKLAASGLLRSGDLGYMLGQEDQNYGNTQYDARQQVLAQLAQYMRDYLDRKNALKQNVWNAYQNSFQNYLNSAANG